ncbi:MAG: DUF2089 family protein [Candidatus Omnitrophota bacterium]|jgi:hypothetical protein|nr:MAG: DUF2089 family protein [Candidatus Omnitrophota bacterium]
MERELPAWIHALDEEDFQFLKRFLLASGSLKALAEEYRISYPTIRLRLDRLIEKVKIADNPAWKDPFQRQLQILLVEGAIDPATARKLLQAFKQTMQTKD